MHPFEALISVFLLPLQELDAEVHYQPGCQVLLLLIHPVLLCSDALLTLDLYLETLVEVVKLRDLVVVGCLKGVDLLCV